MNWKLLEALNEKSLAQQTLDALRSMGAPVPNRLLLGSFGKVQFCATQDGDGHTEISLSKDGGRNLTPRDVRSFFARFGGAGQLSGPTVIGDGKTLHWVFTPQRLH